MSIDARRELLTIMGASARVKVHRRTIYNWMRDGRIEYVRTASGKVRIFADTLFQPAEPRTPWTSREEQ